MNAENNEVFAKSAANKNMGGDKFSSLRSAGNGLAACVKFSPPENRQRIVLTERYIKPPPDAASSELLPVFHGLAQGLIIHKFDLGSQGHALGQTGYFQIRAGFLQKIF